MCVRDWVEIGRQIKQNPTGVFVLKLQVRAIVNQIKPEWRTKLTEEAQANNGWVIAGVIFSPIFDADRVGDLPEKHHLVVQNHHPKGNSLVDPKVGILPHFQGLGLAPIIVGSTDDYARKMELDNVWAYSRPSFYVRYVTEMELMRRSEEVRNKCLEEGVTAPPDIVRAFESYLRGYVESALANKDEEFLVWFKQKTQKWEKQADVLREQYILIRKEEYRDACKNNPLLTLNQFFAGVTVPQVAREYLWVSFLPRKRAGLLPETETYGDFLASQKETFKDGYIKHPDRRRDEKYYYDIRAAQLGAGAFYAWLRDEAEKKDLYKQLTGLDTDDDEINLVEVDRLFKKFLKETNRRGYDLALRALHSKAVPVRFVPGGRPDDYLESDGHNVIMEYHHTPSVLMVMNRLAQLPAGFEFSAAKIGIPEKKLRRALQGMGVSGFAVSEDPGTGVFTVLRQAEPVTAPLIPAVDAGVRVFDVAA